MKDEEKKKNLEEETCNCKNNEDCNCNDECDCDDCNCEKENCDCDCADEDRKTCYCGHEKHKHHHEHSKEQEYLAMAQRLQAEFENYRKRMADQLKFERQEGARSVIEVFLPCLDTFKEAKKSITDENVLSGVNMIENKIMDALKSLNVEKIDAIGQKFDPNLHEGIAYMCNESKDNDIILEEFQAGYKYNNKVIRYSKVIVNKK